MIILQWLFEKWLENGFWAALLLFAVYVFQRVEHGFFNTPETSTGRIALVVFCAWLVSILLYLCLEDDPCEH